MKDIRSKILTKSPKGNKNNAGQLTSDEFENIDLDKEGVELDNVEFTDSSVSNESKKSKMILSWKHAIEKIIINSNSDHDWIVNEYNISKDFHEFQKQTVELLKNNPSLSYAEYYVSLQ